MPVIAFEVTRRAPFAGGVAFGSTGAYERIEASVTFAVDPEHAVNATVVDLKLAPRDERGRVRFRSDAILIQPVDAARGNGCLIVDVANRGRPLYGAFNRASRADPNADAAGDGFAFRHGFSIASIGWQMDVPRDGGLVLDPPEALIDGHPVRGEVFVELRPTTRNDTLHLANRGHRAYPALDVDEAGARLIVREWEDGPDIEAPRASWRFTDGEHITLDGGFEPGRIYYAIYTTEGAPVVGAGLLAVREVASFLRAPSALNPSARGYQRVLGYGVSQTGRVLRTLVHAGLNVSEDRTPAFDGLLVQIGGARRGEFNHRFAQPSTQSAPGFGHLPPFADEPAVDPYTGQTAGLLDRLRASGVPGAAPRIFYMPSSVEYWRGDASLVHIDGRGERDLELAPTTRVYHMAGTQHGAGSLPQQRGAPGEPAYGHNGYNVVDYSPLIRAGLLNLDAWVAGRADPPPSRHPRIDDGTAVPRAATLAPHRANGIETPDPGRLSVTRVADLGPRAHEGIGAYPPVEHETYACFASAVDSDGTEVAGIRLPDVTHPVGTHLPWNLRDASIGAPEQIVQLFGSSVFFKATRTQREAAGDPRPSIEERYASRDAYCDAVRTAALALAAERYVLDEDVGHVVAACMDRYDAAVTGATLS